MAITITMPRQGNTVESCVLVGWRVKEGQPVKAADIICDVETDKAVFEIPAGSDGSILKLLVAEGDDVPVLSPIAVVGAQGEDWRAGLPGEAVAAASSAIAPAAVAAASQGAAGSPTDARGAAARAVPPAVPSGVPLADSGAWAQAGGSAGRPGDGGAPGVSPRARRLAWHEALDPGGLAGSGPGGRVLERDVFRAVQARGPLSAAARVAAATAGAGFFGAGVSGAAGGIPGTGGPGAATGVLPAGVSGAGFPGPYTETEIRGIRKIIAERMRESLAGTAQFTVQAAARASRLQELRARFKTAPASLGFAGVTVGDIVLFVVSRVLKNHPLCNSLKLEDSVRTFERVHLGLAVDTPRGLMVPVIRNADLLPLQELSAEAKRLAAACVSGSINPDELSGSTFTVSNLGSIGVEYFTPVINAPEVCVLGVGAILPKAFAGSDGSYTLEPAMGLSLTADHQAVDGAPAARLLAELCAALADADLWIAKCTM